MRKIIFAAASSIALSTGVASAADLGAPRTPMAAAVVSPAFNWTGFYIGAHAGYGFGRTDGITNAGVVFPLNGSGPLVGGQLGFNYQINSLVLGVEAELAFAAISARNFQNPLASVYHRTSMLGSVRARAGYAVDRSLFYVTGGLGFENAGFGVAAGATPVEKYTRVGWTLGAGYEYAVAQNWTVKAEYAYFNFGTRTLGPIYAGTVRSDVHTLKLGVNYLFSTGPGAVVARY
jgi:outer membrane immunogenic protein